VLWGVSLPLITGRSLILSQLCASKIFIFDYSDRLLGKDYLPYADVIVELGEKTRMYRGVISEFTTDETGTLKDIPGDCLILKYSEIKNLNVTYVRLPSPSSLTKLAEPSQGPPTEALDLTDAPFVRGFVWTA